MVAYATSAPAEVPSFGLDDTSGASTHGDEVDFSGCAGAAGGGSCAVATVDTSAANASDAIARSIAGRVLLRGKLPAHLRGVLVGVEPREQMEGAAAVEGHQARDPLVA